jgi:UDP-perosamine 4-acetyltransferase
MRRLVIVCAEKEVIELAELSSDVEIVGVIDSDPTADACGHSLLGSDDSWPELAEGDADLRVVVAMDSPQAKQRLVTLYGKSALASLISPYAILSRSAKLGIGSIVQHHCKILAKSRLGLACKVNSDAVVHHDCEVGDYCTLAPGSRLLGKVRLSPRVFVGAGATVMPGVSVGADSIIGAGAVVTEDVSPGVVVAGVPARQTRTTNQEELHR